MVHIKRFKDRDKYLRGCTFSKYPSVIYGEHGKSLKTLSAQHDWSPDRVSTAIRCRKATGNQCASVSGTSLKKQRKQKFKHKRRKKLFLTIYIHKLYVNEKFNLSKKNVVFHLIIAANIEKKEGLVPRHWLTELSGNWWVNPETLQIWLLYKQWLWLWLRKTLINPASWDRLM